METGGAWRASARFFVTLPPPRVPKPPRAGEARGGFGGGGEGGGRVRASFVWSGVGRGVPCPPPQWRLLRVGLHEDLVERGALCRHRGDHRIETARVAREIFQLVRVVREVVE